MHFLRKSGFTKFWGFGALFPKFPGKNKGKAKLSKFLGGGGGWGSGIGGGFSNLGSVLATCLGFWNSSYLGLKFRLLQCHTLHVAAVTWSAMKGSPLDSCPFGTQQFPNAVVLDAVRRRKSANARKRAQMSAKERLWEQKGAKEHQRAQNSAFA